MSLESEIKNLTGAMTRLAEGVEKLLSISQPSAAPAVVRVTVDPDTKAADVVAAPRKSEAPEPAAKSEAPQASMASSAGAEVVAPTFDDAKRAFLAIAQKYGAVEGTTKSRDVLSRYGVPNLKTLKPELYGEFIELCETVAGGGAA